MESSRPPKGFPTWNDNCDSLLRRHLTPEVFNELTSVRTSRGVTLEKMIESGVTNQDSHVGVYLGDSESYEKFARLLVPIIEDYHQGVKVSPCARTR